MSPQTKLQSNAIRFVMTLLNNNSHIFSFWSISELFTGRATWNVHELPKSLFSCFAPFVYNLPGELKISYSTNMEVDELDPPAEASSVKEAQRPVAQINSFKIVSWQTIVQDDNILIESF